MKLPCVNIHTHRPTGRGIELHTAGVHPWDADRLRIDDILPLLNTPRTAGGTKLPAPQSAASTSRPVSNSTERPAASPNFAPPAPGSTILPYSGGIQAIGEIGLDFTCTTDRAAQYAAFRAQLRLAVEWGLPVVIHCVRAFEPIMTELAACEPRAVIFHGFIGSPEQARRAVARGYFLSFGERTFASPRTLAALRSTPLSHIFLETDDSPTPIETIYARAAEALNVSVEELLQATNDNYQRIFPTNNE